MNATKPLTYCGATAATTAVTATSESAIGIAMIRQPICGATVARTVAERMEEWNTYISYLEWSPCDKLHVAAT